MTKVWILMVGGVISRVYDNAERAAQDYDLLKDIQEGTTLIEREITDPTIDFDPNKTFPNFDDIRWDKHDWCPVDKSWLTDAVKELETKNPVKYYGSAHIKSIVDFDRATEAIKGFGSAPVKSEGTTRDIKSEVAANIFEEYLKESNATIK